MRFHKFTLTLGAALLALAPAAAQVTLDRPFPEPLPYPADSGLLGNPSIAPKVVHEQVVRVDGAAWLRVYFGDGLALGQGSFLRVTSDQDGQVQELDAEALKAWSHSTAYFNGESVRVELVAGPRTRDNRLIIDSVAAEEGGVPTGECGICGPDDRVSSDEDFAARLVPAGCSATIYNSQSCAVSAGHCVSGGMVLQFKVPPSNSNCSINQPPIADQFPVTQFSFTNGGTGNDWAVLVMGTNNQGQKPFGRYGASMPIAGTPPATNNNLTIWGYGIDSPCVFSQTQQTSDGKVTSVSSTLFNHDVDATFGNSGSALVRNGNEILGIATHCPCPNWATRVDHPNFKAARDSLCPTNAPQAAGLISFNVLMGVPVSGGLGELGLSDNQYFAVDSATVGSRNNAMTEVVAQSPSSTVSQLSVKVEYGAANASPVFFSVMIFNDDTDLWEGISFGPVSTSADTTTTVADIPNPNAYIDATGKIRLRVAETARVVQTPAGFTKRVDQVLVTIIQ